MNDIVGNKDDRKNYLDYLRVLATFAVIILHVAVQDWYTANLSESDWIIYNCYESLVRWAVPVFVMISGALFLNREITCKLIYSKYILRLIVAFFFWSIIYVLKSALSFKGGVKFRLNGSINDIIRELLEGQYHMWFILMMIGLYMCIPVFRQIIRNKKTLLYFLVISFVFAFIIPWVIQLCMDFVPSEDVRRILSYIQHDINIMRLDLFMGYSFYFLVGYYLNGHEIQLKNRRILYILGLVGAGLTCVLEAMVIMKSRELNQVYYDHFSVNVAITAIALFVFLRNKRYTNEKWNHVMEVLAKYSFGAYLIHVMVIDKLADPVGLSVFTLNPVLSIPLIAVIAFFISFGVSALMNHMPVIKKYCV